MTAPGDPTLLLGPPPAPGTPNIPFFSKLQDAIDDSMIHTTLRIWSCDISSFSGAKSFAVASIDDFWMYYSHLPPNIRSFYEVIGDGPLFLYIDVDVDLSLNPNVDSEGLLSTLIGELCSLFAAYYPKDVAVLSKGDFVVLDSSNSKKISMHLIGRPRTSTGLAAWQNMDALILFMDAWFDWAEHCPSSDVLRCKKKGGGCVVDHLIYNVYRSFRLFLSSKRVPTKREQRIMVRSPHCPYKEKEMTDEVLFRTSLIQNVPNDAFLLQ